MATTPTTRGFDGQFFDKGGAVINVKHADFGAVGDGITDDTAAIQGAINAAIYSALGAVVYLPPGLYKTTDVLHAGYGANSTHGGATGHFNSVIIRGAGKRLRGEGTISGTAILPAFSDRPCINFQGSRGSRLEDLGLVGQLTPYIRGNQMGSPGAVVPLIDDTVAANWVNPALAATQDSRYAPYAGVAVDAYAGVRPGTSYPDVSYPTFLADRAQYGKDFSSDVLLDNVYIGGFNTAVVVQPCDADGNGDFVKLRNVFMEECKYGLSVGNSQSRNIGMEGCVASAMYAVLTNNVHGKQIGKLSGHIDNLSCYGIIHLLQFGDFYAEPLTFTNPYAEDVWRIGDIAALSANDKTITFINPEFNFSNQTDARGYPANVLGGGQQPIGITFHGGGITLYHNASVAGFFQFGVAFDDLFYVRRDAGRASTYQQLAHNALAGGIVTPQLATPERCRIRTKPFNLDTGVQAVTSYTTGRYTQSSRPWCVPFYCESYGAQSAPFDAQPLPQPSFSAVLKSSLSSCSLSGSTLTIVFSSRTDQQFMQAGPLPGDVLWDDQTQSVFFVRSRTTTTVLAELQNNYKLVAAVVTPLVAFSTTVGTLWWRNSRLYTPTFYTRGDFAAASTSVTNVARDDGANGYVTTDIVAGDAFAIFEQNDLYVSTTDALVNTVAAATITLDSAAAVRTQVRRRVGPFWRQPPANV